MRTVVENRGEVTLCYPKRSENVTESDKHRVSKANRHIFYEYPSGFNVNVIYDLDGPESEFMQSLLDAVDATTNP